MITLIDISAIPKNDMATSTPAIFKIALAQMRISSDTESNIVNAKNAIRDAAKKDADLCVLPELFTNRYIGQFENVESMVAQLPDCQSITKEFGRIARDASIAAIVPYVEILGSNIRYNSEVLIDKHGKVVVHYRKLHIPYGPGYHEDLYFKPGDKGYAIADLNGVKIGLGICWDQWFPEFSRILALKGAQLIVYPSAIGSEIVEPDYDSRPSWELVMRAQAVMNRIFIAAVNRVGQEEKINFYGGSFIVDPWGNVLKRASIKKPELLVATIDTSQIDRARSFFGFFDTRRPDSYHELISEDMVPTRKANREAR